MLYRVRRTVCCGMAGASWNVKARYSPGLSESIHEGSSVRPKREFGCNHGNVASPGRLPSDWPFSLFYLYRPTCSMLSAACPAHHGLDYHFTSLMQWRTPSQKITLLKFQHHIYKTSHRSFYVYRYRHSLPKVADYVSFCTGD